MSCFVVEWVGRCVPAAEQPASCVRPKPAVASASLGKAGPTVRWHSDKVVHRRLIGTIPRAFESMSFLNRLPLEGGPPCPPPGRPEEVGKRDPTTLSPLRQGYGGQDELRRARGGKVGRGEDWEISLVFSISNRFSEGFHSSRWNFVGLA